MLTPQARDRVINGLRSKIRTQQQHGGVLLLTPVEVATLFRVNAATVRRWAESGRLPCIKTPNGHRRYPWETVKRHLQLLEIEVPE